MWAFNGWGRAPEQDWNSLDKGLTFVLTKLAGTEHVFARLALDHELVWWCGHFQSTFDGGPELSPGLLARLGAFGANLYIDNYFSMPKDEPDESSDSVFLELMRLVDSRSQGDRLLAIERLLEVRTPRALKAIVRLSRDRSADVRMRAVEALGNLSETDPGDLVHALWDRDELVRIQAVESIVSRKETEKVDHLRQMLTDSSALVRSYAAAAVGALGVPTDRRRLRRRLANEKSDAARLGFFEGLWLLKDRTVLDDALRLLDSNDHRVRCATASAMAGTFVSPRTRARINAALKSRLAREKTVAARDALERALTVVSRPAQSADSQRNL